MLETRIMGRGTGKTTKVIELLQEDSDSLLIIPFKHMKNIYPNEMQNRIITTEDVVHGELSGRRVSKVILDEGFFYDKERLAHLYYLLGYERLNVIAYGTI